MKAKDGKKNEGMDGWMLEGRRNGARKNERKERKRELEVERRVENDERMTGRNTR